ncbi:hypothetical protein LJA00_08480 [Campylobacter jejuni]
MLKLLDFHRKLYEKRWHGELETHEDMKKYEHDFLNLATEEKVSDEQVNELMNQLYIPPYKYDLLPDHLKETDVVKKVNPKRGGKREGAGRPSLGTTKKLSITLPDEIWKQIDDARGNRPLSAFLREIITNGNWI